MELARAAATALAMAAIVGCGNPPETTYDPQLDPADFVAAVTNPFFPLTPEPRITTGGSPPMGPKRSPLRC